MVAGIELEQYATGHETSNQQSRKQSFPNTNLDRLGKTGNYLQLRSFTFCTAQSSGTLDGSQDKLILPLHGGWHRTRKICPCQEMSYLVAVPKL